MRLSTRAILKRNLTMALGIAIVLFSLRYFQFINFRELNAVDFRILLRGEQKAHPDIVLIEIDEASLKKYGHWPWPRDLHLRMIETLSRYQPRFVFYDVVFTEPDSDSSVDRSMAKVIEKSANVILPFFYHSEEPLEAFYPIKIFRESARAIGFMNVVMDSDGKARRIKVSLNSGDTRYFHASVLPVLSGFRDEEAARQWLAKLPLNRKGELWINFPGRASSFSGITFQDVFEMQPEDLERLLRDKIVLVGQTARESQHRRPTVFYPDMPGLVIQAGAMHTLLSGKYLREVNRWTGFLIMVLLAVYTAFWSGAAATARRALLWVLGGIAGYSLINFGFFYFAGVLLPSFMPIVVMILTYVCLLFFSNSDMRFQSELVKRELAMAAKIQKTFFPETKPDIPGFDIAFKCHFAAHIGGDFYDWADFGDGKISLAVGDVSGKGIPAAIYMVCAIGEFRRENKPGRSPAKALEGLNHQLATQTYSGMFLTLTSAVIDSRAKSICISSAGHEPFLYYRAVSRKVEVMDPVKGPPLGLFTDAQYEDFQMNYDEGDLLLLLSDGVKESRDLKGQHFGLHKMESYLQEHASFDSAEDIVQGIFELMEDHMQGGSAHDDRTVFCIKLGSRF